MYPLYLVAFDFEMVYNRIDERKRYDSETDCENIMSDMKDKLNKEKNFAGP